MLTDETIPEGVHRAAALMFPLETRCDSDADFRKVIEMAYLAGQLDGMRQQERSVPPRTWQPGDIPTSADLRHH